MAVVRWECGRRVADKCVSVFLEWATVWQQWSKNRGGRVVAVERERGSIRAGAWQCCVCNMIDSDVFGLRKCMVFMVEQPPKYIYTYDLCVYFCLSLSLSFFYLELSV